MPNILRTWRGRIRTADKAEYVATTPGTGRAEHASTPGNLGYQMVTRSRPDHTAKKNGATGHPAAPHSV